ncbi:MAG: HEAT repeat domain-containing protein [Mucilaginibacter sp.]|uniref:HEAT repeat domain-containing protein n=1 Tax=Mucilaginibacter sp. TaxID=1882438 RepID=UPI0034E3B3B1
MKSDLEGFIRSNLEGLDTNTPNPDVLNRVLQQMDGINKKQHRGILIPFQVLQWTAAILVFISCALVFILLQKPVQNSIELKAKNTKHRQVDKAVQDTAVQIAATPRLYLKKRRSIGAIDDDLNVRKKKLFVQIKVWNSKKEVMFAALNNMESPARRVNAVSDAVELNNKDNSVVDALVATLNHDPSPNVRLAALDGLAHFYKEVYVRKQLVASLKKQQDPVVQIVLIQLLTRMKESSILNELDKLVNDEKTLRAVKDCAYSCIYQLRSS